jgi:hypothetical protein
MQGPDTSPISALCNSVADFIRAGLDAQNNNVTVSIGAPAESSKLMDMEKHCVNMFFYRLESGGFDADVLPGEPWRIRLYCLITVFGASENNPNPGVNELWILGELMQLFHENPIMQSVDIQDNTVRLQIIPLSLTSDELNHIWSTQGDVSYRPSISYEMALVPILPEKRTEEPKLVGSIGSQISARMYARFESYAGSPNTLPVSKVEIDINNPLWRPAICFVIDGLCAQAFNIALSSPNLDALELDVWVAGNPQEEINLQWEVWTPDGWVEQSYTKPTHPVGAWIDPERPHPIALEKIGLPVTDAAGQAILYAVRDIQSDSSPATQVRSNPLLVSIYE